MLFRIEEGRTFVTNVFTWIDMWVIIPLISFAVSTKYVDCRHHGSYIGLLVVVHTNTLKGIYIPMVQQSVLGSKPSEVGQFFVPQKRPSWHSLWESQSPSFCPQVLSFVQ